jgi:hypothetical protein
VRGCSVASGGCRRKVLSNSLPSTLGSDRFLQITGAPMDISRTKNVFAHASTGIAVVAILIFTGNIAYHMATSQGGDITCTSQTTCYDNFCTWLYLGMWAFISMLYVFCMLYCHDTYDPDNPEVANACRLQCALIYVSWVLMILIALELFCRVTPQ